MRQANEVPKIIVRGLCLGKRAVGLFLDRVNDVWKFDRVLDEEHRNVVAYDVPVTFPRVQFYRKAPDVAGKIKRTFTACNSRESYKGRSALAGMLKQFGASVFREWLIVFKETMRAIAAGVNDALWNPLMVEMEYLLAKMKILDQCRPPRPNL
jgi:truncated hemoglobin YjbI